LATRRNGGGGAGGSGDETRPRIRTSHEKPKPAARGARRAATSPLRVRAIRKVAPPEVPADAQGAWSVASESARETAAAIAVAALDKKAVGVEVLDVAGKVDYADFLVIMTGRSDRHAQALAQGIEEALRKKGVRPVAVEGLPHATWVLMDFGDVVVHVFQHDARQLYDIDGLWLDARRLPVPVAAPNE
jgi:ribosome-associated protein